MGVVVWLWKVPGTPAIRAVSGTPPVEVMLFPRNANLRHLQSLVLVSFLFGEVHVHDPTSTFSFVEIYANSF